VGSDIPQSLDCDGCVLLDTPCLPQGPEVDDRISRERADRRVGWPAQFGMWMRGRLE
jgi:hypothetical protein